MFVYHKKEKIKDISSEILSLLKEKKTLTSQEINQHLKQMKKTF